MITTVLKLDKVVLPGGVEFSHVVNGRVAPEIETFQERPAGHPFAMFRANTIHRPVATWTTQQIDVVLANLSVAGETLLLDSYLYEKIATRTGIPNRASAIHNRYRMPKGIVYWTNISLPHNGRGTADLMLMSEWDGTNDPLISQGSVVLPGNLIAGNHFGAGPVRINGVNIPGIQQIDVACSVQLIQAGDASEEFDSFIGIETSDPVVTITSNQRIDVGTLGLRGTTLNGSAGIVMYGRKYAANGSRVANGTAEHIAMQGLLGTALPVENTGAGTSAKSFQLRCELVASSDSVVPLVGFTGQTIP